MNQATSCLSPAVLRRFLLGQTGEEESAALEGHLLHCEQCLRTVQALPADDPLIAALQEGREFAKQPPHGGLLEKLRQRLREVRPAPREDTARGDNTALTVPPSALPLDEPGHGGPALAPPQQPDEIGRLGGYRILKELGRGGMGVVYLAEDAKLKRLVALKAVLPHLAANVSAGQRFLREAQAMAAVEHDHIVRIYQVDEDRGVPFLAMEFLKGEPLDQRLKRESKGEATSPLPLPEVLRIGREIAEGLGAAHARGLIHRDIKPGNIWLEAPRNRVKILDFGLARAAAQDAALTQQGAVVGTPAFMAPEQARGESLDGRCDLFSLGVVLYRLCTGQQPFKGTDAISTLMEVALTTPPPPTQLNPKLPHEISDMVMQLLEKDPARRPATAGEVVRAIHDLEMKLARKRQAEERTEPLKAGPPKPAAVARPKKPAPALAPVAAPAPRRSGPSRMFAAAVVLGLVLVGAAAALLVFASGVIRLPGPGGDYVIDTDDPNFFFQVHDDVVTLEDRKANKTYKLKVVREDKKTGEFALEVTEGDLGFMTKTFTIKRGDKVALTALFEPKAAPNPPAEKLDDAWLKKVAAMPFREQVEEVVAELKRRNPDFKGPAIPRENRRLDLLAGGVTDLSPVRALADLKELIIEDRRVNLRKENTRLSDLTPLKGLKELTSLKLVGTHVSDLTPLNGMPLTELGLAGSPVSDLSPLKDMKTLMILILDATKVSDLSPLKGLPLQSLFCSDTSVSDLSPLKDMRLKSLHIVHTKVTDLSLLKGMPLLTLECDFQPDRDGAILRSIPTLEKINGQPAKDVLSGASPPADDAFVKKVAALPVEKQVEAVVAELERLNPNFDGNGIPGDKTTPAGYSYNGKLNQLFLKVNDVTDLSPVRALAGLEELALSPGEKSQLADLSPLKGLKLKKLTIGGTQVSDLTPLKGMPLTELILSDTKVSSLAGLEGMPLRNLNLTRTPVADLSPLKDMKTLKILSLIDSPVSDLSPLKGLSIDGLVCQNTSVSDLTPLKDVKLTTQLTIIGSPVSDLTPLRGASLGHLTLESTKVSSLAGLEGMSLSYLNLNHTQVADLAPLKDMKTLSVLQCNATQVSDLSPLKGRRLKFLFCSNTRVSDLSVLKGMPLEALECDFQPERDGAILRSIPTLVTINGLPAAVFWKEVDGKKDKKP